jgi:hypothetical protein
MTRALCVALAVLMSTPVAPDTGNIWLRTIPGAVVTVDGRPAGVTTVEEAGLQILGLEAGRHQLTLTIPGRGSTTLQVDVEAAQTTTVDVPALALNARRSSAPGAVEVEVFPFRRPCSAVVDDVRYELRHPWMRSADVPAGKHQVIVSCGGRTLKKEVDVPAERTVLVRADMARSDIAVAGDRPRVTPVAVRSSSSVIEEANIPEALKRAILAGLGPGVEVIRLTLGDPGVLKLELEETDGFFSLWPLYEAEGVIVWELDVEFYSLNRWRLILIIHYAP